MLKADSGKVSIIGGATANLVKQIAAPTFPQFRFEWHPEKEKVYLVDLINAPTIGECIHEHSKDYGQAFGAVQTWLRGYKFGAKVGIIEPAKKAG